MKLCAKFSFLLLISILFLVASTASAIEPAVRDAGLPNQAMTFDHIEKVQRVQLSSTSVITPSDNTATNTASTYYLPDDFEYPIELEIQNQTAASITYNIYSASSGTGVDVPDATDPAVYDVNGALCVNNKIAKFVFYQAPNVSFGSAGTATATFTVRSIKGQE
jgi:hypothetical protein